MPPEGETQGDGATVDLYAKASSLLETFEEEIGRIELPEEGRRAIQQQMRAFLSTVQLATSWKPAVAGVGHDTA